MQKITPFLWFDSQAEEAVPREGSHAHTDLDHLAGTWSAKDEQEFALRTKAFEAIDEELWR